MHKSHEISLKEVSLDDWIKEQLQKVEIAED